MYATQIVRYFSLEFRSTMYIFEIYGLKLNENTKYVPLLTPGKKQSMSKIKVTLNIYRHDLSYHM